MKLPNITQRFRRDPTRPQVLIAVPRWVASVILAMIVVFSVLGTVGYLQISDLQHKSKHQSACINSNLGARAQPSLDLTIAQRDWARAEKIWATAQDIQSKTQGTTSAALFALLNASASGASKAEQSRLYTIFLADFANGQAITLDTQKALDAYLGAVTTYLDAIEKVYTSQTNHPLGRC